MHFSLVEVVATSTSDKCKSGVFIPQAVKNRAMKDCFYLPFVTAATSNDQVETRLNI